MNKTDKNTTVTISVWIVSYEFVVFPCSPCSGLASLAVFCPQASRMLSAIVGLSGEVCCLRMIDSQTAMLTNKKSTILRIFQ
eukprot:525714-Amphidinium_carterae.1